jgi:PAS domain S-box-containing protein
MQGNMHKKPRTQENHPPSGAPDEPGRSARHARNPLDSIIPGGLISLFVLFAVSVSIGLVVMIDRYHNAQYRDALLRTAAESSRGITNFRLFYSREIVSRLRNSDILITHDYQLHERAIPLPATMSIEFGRFLEETGSGNIFRLFSDKPFPWRTDRHLDDFEQAALKHLQANPGDTYDRMEHLNGKEYLRYATPVVMQESCVNCHNSHAESPFRQWKVGDVRGVQEILLATDRAGPAYAGSSRAFRHIIVFIITAFGIALATIFTLAKRNRIAFDEMEELARLEQAERHAVSLSMEQVKEGLARHKAVLEEASDGIVTIDEQGLIETINPAAERIFGYSLNELRGRNVALLMPREHAVKHDQYIARYLKTGQSRIIGIGRELVGRRKHGEEFPMELSISEVKLADRRLFTGIVRDITERKNAEEALRHSEAQARQLSMVAARTDNAVIITDRKGRIEWVNNGFSRISGYAFDEVKGRTPGSVLQGPESDPEIVHRMSTAIDSHRGFREEILNYNKDGKPYWILIEAQPIYDTHGEVVQFMAIERDITEEKERRLELEQARIKAEEASRAKSRFLAMMSHEIRTPLNGVIGTLGLLRDTDLSGEQKKYVETGRYSAENLLTIINDILSFSKLEAGKDDIEESVFELRSLVESIGEVLSTRAREKSLALHFEADSVIPSHLAGDAGKIRQVLMNLAGNAVKFTERGEVRIRVSLLSHDGDELRLRFMVSDTGVGISAEDQKSLFDEFWTLSPAYHTSGTGLGLAICRNLVEIMSGSIDMESTPGKGSRFWFDIPLSVPSKDTLEDVANHAEEPQENRLGAVNLRGRVLLADDSPANLMVGVGMLERLGLQVDTVSNGLEAVDALRTRPYDLVLMDIGMPEMDGIEATREIRKLGGETARIPVIAMTAHVMKGDREKILAEGLDDYICKPVNAGELIARLQHWLSHDNGKTGGKPPATSAARTQDTSPEVLDSALLEQLFEETGHDLAPALLNAFLQELDIRQENIRQARETANLEQITLESHALKSCAASYGASRLSVIAERLEAAGRGSATDEAMDLADDMAAEIETTREAFMAISARIANKTR